MLYCNKYNVCCMKTSTILWLCVICCISLFVLLFFFFWPLCCLSVDLLILIRPLLLPLFIWCAPWLNNILYNGEGTIKCTTVSYFVSDVTGQYSAQQFHIVLTVQYFDLGFHIISELWQLHYALVKFLWF